MIFNRNIEDTFIWQKENSLTKEFCDHCIAKFEKDENKKQGQTGGGINLNVKRSIDLSISSYDLWDSEDKTFFNSLNTSLTEYQKFLSRNLSFSLDILGNLSDSGYHMQKTGPGEFYSWHHDFVYSTKTWRFLTYIWYLNDVHDGGYTEFYNGMKIQPKTGKLLLFPATWNYYHRGYPPKTETKYICTGWISTTESDEMSKKLSNNNMT